MNDSSRALIILGVLLALGMSAAAFAKNGGGTQLGPMRSASQGSFYILPARADNEVSDYAGTYDKSTIDKKARVVVTIEYGIQ